ncbi:MAG: hypothetical protein M3220_18735 [Chloroflexota bacterium]|nr:hypothetical protein [Chloroflexota bacterium]
MKVFVITLDPLSSHRTHASRPLRAIPDFQKRGHEVYVAAPLVGVAGEIRRALDVQGVLPLYDVTATTWGRLILNAYRVAYWGQQWKPEIYLSIGARSATLAHGSRGATGGYGLSVLVLPALCYESGSKVGGFIEWRAIHECDRLITYDADFADRLVIDYGARGGDLTLLTGDESDSLATICEAYVREPPGFHRG